MNTMQAFHDVLFNSEDPQNPYLECLVRLTKASADEVSALKSDVTWNLWPNV
jgi:hypothetical protein